jgi:hypothetical protein
LIVPVIGTAVWYMKELSKYAPQFKIGFLSNNPRVYDLLPKAAEPSLSAQRAVRKNRRLSWVWLACSPESGTWRSVS